MWRPQSPPLFLFPSGFLIELDEMLEQKKIHMCNHSYANNPDKILVEKKINLSKCESDDDDEEQKALEDLVKEHAKAKETY
ncbi:uncharacterized protein HKW66_Vig0114920 [Vigna angularis]|uniref:Uncharacterized protein n=1 Tax=Phaseolus angularis TaxID=3914 RepID=A0A8T0KW60_PHAAN|nr:uncharacterized protein HKW66_Vig0114920 [Vigna angularis]